jgi:hypothetical protein
MKRFTRVRRGLLVCSVFVVVGAVGTATGFASTQSRPVSHFKKSAEHWTVSGDPVSAKPKFHRTGGNPGGFIETTDAAQGGIMYWTAPTKFLGDRGAAYAGTLSFDLRESAAGHQFDAADVIIKGGGFRLTYDTAANPGVDWTHYVVPLSETGWFNGADPATHAEMLSVLASLSRLLIRAEFASHTEVDDLDNVVIKNP